MAGSPLKRARKQGIRLDDGSIIAFPYMPGVADRPRGWRHFSTADKIKHLLGMSLDRALEIVSWPLAECDPPRLSLQVQVIRIVVKIAGKVLLDGSLDRCYEILSWRPITDLDPLRRSMQMQVMRVLLPIGIKAVLDGSLDRELTRERDRERVLAELWRLAANR